jgi:hypothetical protein
MAAKTDLVCSDPRCYVMEHRRRRHTLCIRDARQFCRGRAAERHGVCEGHEDEREGDETPAVVTDVVEFEVVWCEVELGGRSEPLIYVSRGSQAAIGTG